MIKYICYAMWTTLEYTEFIKCILKVLKSFNPNIHFTYEKEVESKLFVMCCSKEMVADLCSKFMENQLIQMLTSTATLFYQMMKKCIFFKRFKRVKKKEIKKNFRIKN